MTDVELTSLSTVAWAVATSALFILLARWSTGGSWGITSGIVDGVRSWSRHDRSGETVASGGLPPLDLPMAQRPDNPRRAPLPWARVGGKPEIEELPSRRI